MSDRKEEPLEASKPNIIYIGRKGKLKGDAHKVYRLLKVDVENDAKIGSNDKKPLENRFRKHHSSELHEIYKTELNDELIKYDLQYFHTFCSLLYFVRAFHLFYQMFHKYRGIHEIQLETVFDEFVFFVEIIFIVVLFIASLTGFAFCWLMYLSFVFPYVISLLLATLLIGFRLILQMVYINDNVMNKRLGYESNKFSETFLDVGVLFITMIVGFCVIALYIQISKSQRVFEYEPNSFKFNGKEWLREMDSFEGIDRVVYTIKPESRSATSE